MSETNKTKAFNMLSQVKSISDRASHYFQCAKEDLYIKLIKGLERQVSEIDQQIFDASDFNLETNLNKGHKQMSTQECTERFERIIQLKHEKTLLELELKNKREAFVELFGDYKIVDDTE